MINTQAQYYYLASSLPLLSLEQTSHSEQSLSFIKVLKDQLTAADLEIFKWLQYPFDNQNFVHHYILQNKKFDGRGTLDLVQLKDIQNSKLPEYLEQFAEKYFDAPRSKSSLEWEQMLWSNFYTAALSSNNTFIKKWYAFELKLKNAQLIFNAKKHEYSYDQQIIFTDEDMRNDLLHKDFLESFESDYPEIKPLMDIVKIQDIVKREQELDQLKFDFIEHKIVFDYFSVEQILAYFLKLCLVERWNPLNESKGKIKLNEIIENKYNAFNLLQN